MKSAWILCAQGSEELEVVGVANVLRRAGIHTQLVSLEPGLEVQCARKVHLLADRHWQDGLPTPDVMVLPGGLEGTERQANHQGLRDALRLHQAEGKWLAAMDTAPVLTLQAQDLLPEGAQLTAHPGFHDRLPANGRQPDALVVMDHQHKLITSQGPGTALLFALAIVEVLVGEEAAQRIAAPLVIP
ncbi:DJ-1/PfpI family protein [Gallaecimonas kandeliae]|uniref:DJ-1 family glyoxalase III n=1 Tax=Gallaecimonas kandeliae TaxID=3029055 RepID=UPI002648891E|nr:DJ-1 family glyoxalase III [Gallaecimonas kandeliae]WKE64902.1 DJ-1/PfpI family protein [Gallaecimonas kandeliae]